MVAAHSIERGVLAISSIIIGKDCKIGMHSVISPETSLDYGVTLEPMSMVPLGTALPPMTSWEGVPVQPKPEKKQKKAQKSAADRLRGVRAALPRGHSGGHAHHDAEEEAQGTPLAAADLRSAQCFGFLISAIASWIAFLPMSIGVVKHFDSNSNLSVSLFAAILFLIP